MGLARVNIESLFDVPLRQLLNQPEGQPFNLRAGGRFRFHAQVKRPQQPAPIQARDFRPAAEAEPQAQGNGFTLASINLGDPRVDKAVRQAERLLEKDIPILVHGETGVGKEVFAENCAACHSLGELKPSPLLAIPAAVESPQACLSNEPIPGLPHYDLTEAQRDSLLAFLAGERAKDGTSGDQVEPPPPEDASVAASGVLQEGRSEWGRLPQRIREIMSQARRDRISAIYQQATEAYYRRMAEEKSP